MSEPEPIVFVSIQVGATVYKLFVEADRYTLEVAGSFAHLTASEAFHRKAIEKTDPKDKNSPQFVTRRVEDFEAFGQAAYSLSVAPPSWWANRYD